MTDYANLTPLQRELLADADDGSWLAELRTGREAQLAEAARRGIGEQMLDAATEGIERAEILGLIKGSVHQCDPSELPTWLEVSGPDIDDNDRE